jgi:hypothetical protein
LYAGTEGDGVFTSTDGGDHWQPINDELTNRTVYAMAMDPQDPHTIYAGTVASSVFVLHVGDDPGQPGGSGSVPATAHRQQGWSTHPRPGTTPGPESRAPSLSAYQTEPAQDTRGSVLSLTESPLTFKAVMPEEDPERQESPSTAGEGSGETRRSMPEQPQWVDPFFTDLDGSLWAERTRIPW